ncbi:type II CRISPR RNA-guided endonuclease Cas9 [Puniceicoccus vermicola]|uniref:HNH Cas9-type domain-containing protein n=1 Tax=Puniceicoccus vermicola TaxID=388746 RepID=A0A7X1AVJ0_9BACT|nr:type II CRISPR RNA-guided endonuclease Cas9 [Puniceicoccus vermicola]MBC2600602.1 hypothetical protein [Puniceicoccus vermicola]
MPKQVSFAFDIGHASIGWAAIKKNGAVPELLGCGVVTFRPDDCQNHQRAAFRRGRRHIAATRNRMKRLESLLLHLEVLSKIDIQNARENPHPWPWLLAAQILTGQRQALTWAELWAVIRWYAHNRGYDGNALWSGEENEDDKEDTQKVENANRLMGLYQTSTMAETVCAFLGVDPANTKNPSLESYFKGQDAAFPRSVVRAEVVRILEVHFEKLPRCDKAFVEALCGAERDSWKRIPCPSIRLPKRFHGGLLFGQMVPRFDNRIIPLCRISGEKTPDKNCRDFYRFRWGMLLCNLRVSDDETESRRLNAAERQLVHQAIQINGYLTPTGLKTAIEKATGATPINVDQMFMTPEMEKALVLDPVRREISSQKISPIWETIPERFQKRFAGRLFKNRRASLAQWREDLAEGGVELSAFDQSVEYSYEAYAKRKKKQKLDLPEFCSERISVASASGRAPYSRTLMAEAWEAVFDDSKPDPKDRGGCLEESLEVVTRQIQRSIDEKTNNHLVRHRLLIFQELLKDLIKNYADDDSANVDIVALEVIRDLQEFSAKTAKEKAQLMGLKLADHRRAVKLIEKELEKYGGEYRISAGLIKKVRIATDLNWTCPFTGKHYCFDDLVRGNVDREHIIPRSWRPSDALDALVLTWPEVNRLKGQRTAWEFMEQQNGGQVPGTDLRLQPLANYEKFVDSLKPRFDPRKGQRDFIDDDLRKYRRKMLLRVKHFDKRKKPEGEAGGFTGRDLTQTSHLNKLAVLQARDILDRPYDDTVWSLAGSVTAAVRKAWKLEGCLARACPETEGKTKTDIREITHLHHALDAVTIGLAAFYFPKNGKLWDLMSRRQISRKEDQTEFESLSRLPIRFTKNGKWEVPEVRPKLKNQISERLLEKRVIQHQPKTMRGLKVQQNTWRVLHEDPQDENKMVITIANRDENKKRKRSTKTERKSKLLGLRPKGEQGKLAKLKGSLIIEENYGVILDPEIRVLPHLNVFEEIANARKTNGGVNPRVIRGGSLIKVEKGRYEGVWKVFSIKDAKAGFLIDMASPEIVKAANKVRGCVMNARLNSLLKGRLTILEPDYTGHFE